MAYQSLQAWKAIYQATGKKSTSKYFDYNIDIDDRENTRKIRPADRLDKYTRGQAKPALGHEEEKLEISLQREVELPLKPIVLDQIERAGHGKMEKVRLVRDDFNY